MSAKAGEEQLPAFPEPNFLCSTFRHKSDKDWVWRNECMVTFNTEEARKNARAPVSCTARVQFGPLLELLQQSHLLVAGTFGLQTLICYFG